MHFDKYIHKYIRVMLNNGQVFEGVLVGIYDDYPRSDLQFLIFENLGTVRCDAIVSVIVVETNG